jgi:Protein of unknown function (DUF2877)
VTERPPAATFAAPGALAALRDGRQGVVELVLSRGMYVRLGEDWIGLAGPGAEFGPLSVAVRGLSELLSGAVAGASVRVAGRRLLFGGGAVALEGARERRCVAVGISRAPDGAQDAAAAGWSALRELGAPPQRLRAGIDRLGSGAVKPGVLALAGLGDGLTPAGDDVLAGYAAWGAAAQRPPCLGGLARGRSSSLGLAYLRAAERGELPDAGAALLAAVLAGSAPAAAVAARGLRSWGASSGAALGWGILAGATPVFGADLRSDSDR